MYEVLPDQKRIFGTFSLNSLIIFDYRSENYTSSSGNEEFSSEFFWTMSIDVKFGQ